MVSFLRESVQKRGEWRNLAECGLIARMGRMVKRTRNARGFWDREYRKNSYLSLSAEPSEDFLKFCRFLERDFGKKYLNPLCQAIDLGCGNGRNIAHLASFYGVKGLGIDASREAIAQARAMTGDLPLTFEVRSIADPLPVKDSSQTIVIDAMVSHVLKSAERERMLAEVVRVLRPDGWYFFKTFLLDEDRNAAELLRDFPGSEPGSYLHPQFGVEEHVFTQEEIEKLLEPHFFIHKVHKSHGHIRNGQAFRRRSITVYAQKAS